MTARRGLDYRRRIARKTILPRDHPSPLLTSDGVRKKKPRVSLGAQNVDLWRCHTRARRYNTRCIKRRAYCVLNIDNKNEGSASIFVRLYLLTVIRDENAQTIKSSPTSFDNIVGYLVFLLSSTVPPIEGSSVTTWKVQIFEKLFYCGFKITKMCCTYLVITAKWAYRFMTFQCKNNQVVALGTLNS